MDKRFSESFDKGANEGATGETLYAHIEFDFKTGKTKVHQSKKNFIPMRPITGTFNEQAFAEGWNSFWTQQTAAKRGGYAGPAAPEQSASSGDTRLEKLQRLIDNPAATDGERVAAQEAIRRIRGA